MSKKIKVGLSSLKSKKPLSLDDPKISVGDGYCKFPFIYKDEVYKECFKGKKGDWCATELKKDGKMKKFAYCQYDDPKPSEALEVEPPKTPSLVKKTKFVLTKSDGSKSPKLKFVKKQQLDKKFILPMVNAIRPKFWELPNRKNFIEWFNINYKDYTAKKGSLKSGEKESFGFELFTHQKMVRDFLNSNSPYRGLILFHGLGVGKTCASISIAEAFRTDRNILILLNKSLKQNYIVNLLKCGYNYYRLNQNWVFHRFIDNDIMLKYAKRLKIPEKMLKKNRGAWFVNYETDIPNYDSLNGVEKDSLNEQIRSMIDSKYEFIHLDGLNKGKIESMISNKKFDNKLVIIDEVHNITNSMAKSNPGVRGKGIKQLIMNGENLKLLVLSGTPMINNLYETGQLFNLLRGYIKQISLRLVPKPTSTKKIDEIEKFFLDLELIDQVTSNKRDNLIHLVRSPFGFINTTNGFTKSDNNNMTDEEFLAIIKDIISKFDYNVTISTKKYTALPDNEQEFMNLFYDSRKNKLKNPKLFQSRIMGLVSYFKTNDTTLLPTVTVNEIIKIPMSKYQFLEYSKIRKAEIDQDSKKNKKGKQTKKSNSNSNSSKDKNIFDDAKSSYRQYSRMHCSFVFPEHIRRPYISDIPDLDNIKKAVKRSFKQFETMITKYKLSFVPNLKGIEKIESEIEGLTHQLEIIENEINRLKELNPVNDNEIRKLHNIKAGLDEELEEQIQKNLYETVKSRNEIEKQNIVMDDIGDDDGDTESTKKDISKDYKEKIKKFELAKTRTLKKLEKEKETLFMVEVEDQLPKFSPKYNEIIKKTNGVNGLSFIYTEYKTLEGIGVLKIVLKANGYAEFLLEKNEMDEYIQIYENEEDIDKPKFAFWGEDMEKSDLIRKIYNNQFNELPNVLRLQLEATKKNNLRGDIIKILLTTKTGAEGIDLQNVRQVHIVEPYWNPVRLKQVKGRAVRVGSHLQLPPEDRNVEIYTYISYIKPEDLKTDLTILDDNGGMTSDEVLFEISEKKLVVMSELLKLIKESSIDCHLNVNQTKSPDNLFNCMNPPSKLDRNNYSYIANINNERIDVERRRRIKVKTWEPKFVKIPIKGQKVTFALKDVEGEPNYLFDAEATKRGTPGQPIGEIIIEDGVKKVKFFKKLILSKKMNNQNI